MKYAVSLSHFKGNQLVDMDIKIIKASDPTILKDALFKIISLKTGVDHRSYTSSRMGVLWDHNHNKNTMNSGAFKIHQYAKEREEHYVCFYRQIRETDTFVVKEETGDES
jgi:hypothetical protein